MALDLASTNQNQGSGASAPAAQSPAPDPRVAPFAGLLEAACEVQLLLDTDGRIVHVGGSPEYVMGFARATLEQQPVLAAVPAEQRQGFANAFQQVRAGVPQPMFAMNWPSPWQGRFETGVQLSALIEEGKLLGVMFKGYELSTRYAFEAFLRNDAPSSVEQARKSPLAVFFLDSRGQCSFMNDRWAELTGQSVAEAQGYGFLSVIHPNDLERFKQVAGQGNYRKEGWRLLVDLQLPNGGVRRVDAAAAPLLAPDGSVLAYLCAFSPFSTALSADTPLAIPVPGAAPSPTAQQAPSAPAVQQAAPVAAAPVAAAPSAQTAPAAPASVAPQMQVVESPQPQTIETPQPQVAAPLTAPAMTAPAMTAPTMAPPTTQASPTVAAPQMPNFGQAPQASVPFEVPPEVVTQPPTPLGQTQGSWQPPALKEGYTDPALLLGPKKPSGEAEAEAPTLEPGLDKVTGLPNRLLFAQHVASTVSRMQSDALTVSVSFIDLHGLEDHRAIIGSRATNDYMFLLAKRLEATIRSIEIAGRIDGDIVAILSINWLFADDLPVVAQRLLNKLGEPLAGKDGEPVSIAMSLGMAVAQPGEAVNDIFGRAWAALQAAKQNNEKHFEIDFGS